MGVDGWIRELELIVGSRYVLTDPMALLPYSCDGYTVVEAQTRCVVLPRSTEEIRAIVKVLTRAGIPFLARGAGTSLSGGATPLGGAAILHLSRMNRILLIHPDDQVVVVEPGVVNADITRAVDPYGYFYAPDPSSQQAGTIGGNGAENSGGPHCLKYGVTVNHLVAAEVVTVAGEVVQLGNLTGEVDGPDWLGLLVGSEGTLAIATKLWLRLTKKPAASQTILAPRRSSPHGTPLGWPRDLG